MRMLMLLGLVSIVLASAHTSKPTTVLTHFAFGDGGSWASVTPLDFGAKGSWAISEAWAMARPARASASQSGTKKKFINLVKYGDLERIAGARQAHFAYADRLRAQGELAIGGPLLDDQGTRIGLLFVYEAVSRAAAIALARQDPFALANALSGYEITEWRLRGVNLDLLIKANRSADQSDGNNSQVRLFVNYAKYSADKSRLATVRPAHWEYDQELKRAGKLALAGPFANDEGGLFVYNAVRREEAMSFLKRDPFAVGGVFADYQLLEWLIEGVNPDSLVSDFFSSR